MHHICVIGAGSIGERHVRCFLATERCTVSICETDAARRRTIAERYPLRRAFASVEEALSEKADAAVIATPAQLHVTLATPLLRQGLHVLIEKPLGTNFQGVDELRKEAQKHQAVVAVAYNWRAHPALREMRDAILARRFGQPAQVIGVCGSPFFANRPTYREIYYAKHATGGGAVQDAMTHLINAGEWLAGPVERLAADASHQVLEGVDVEDTVHVMTRQGQAMGSYSLNQYQAAPETSITVVCDRGMARFEFEQDRWLWMTEPRGKWQERRFGPFDKDATYFAQAKAFLDAVEHKGQPFCSLDEGVQTLAVNLAILRSARDGSMLVAVRGDEHV